MERVANVSEGQVIYLRRASQLVIDTNSDATRGTTHSFYPGHIQNVNEELCFVSVTQMPSSPPGYGLDHLAGTQLPLRVLDSQDFYRKITN